MKYTVNVKLKAKKEGVEIAGENSLIVRVHAPPVDGAANERIIELIAKHFGKSKSSIQIVKGHTSKTKIVEIS